MQSTIFCLGVDYRILLILLTAWQWTINPSKEIHVGRTFCSRPPVFNNMPLSRKLTEFFSEFNAINSVLTLRTYEGLFLAFQVYSSLTE